MLARRPLRRHALLFPIPAPAVYLTIITQMFPYLPAVGAAPAVPVNVIAAANAAILAPATMVPAFLSLIFILPGLHMP